MSASMLFRLVWYQTKEDNKFQANRIHEYIGDRDAIFDLWFELHESMVTINGFQQNKWKHVLVYDLQGTPCDMSLGKLGGMPGYCP